uniref:Uncharacterized protein n=1 Tax=Tanacetum cinerariifolium TaxID=118510 RepID=A0A699IV63_TANCI|nr:hypothetical protein [Tanacetum cinerariifolium]
MAKFTYFKVKGKLTDSIFNEMLEFFQNIFPTTKGYKLPPSYCAIKKTFKTIRLDFMAKFTYFKVKGKLTDSIFNEMLEFFQNIFPTTKGYKLPPSYCAIKKTFKTIRLGCESIHACVNDCFLFRGEDHKDKQLFPVCNTSRWKDSNTLGKKVPKKVSRYFSVIPRLQRLYKSSHTEKQMTWHATGKCTEHGKMQHPVDGRAWKNFDTKYLNFAKKPRNVQLGLAADGFNPFGNLSQSYSMCRDECRTTQNSGICSPGEDGEMYYGQLEQILEFSYNDEDDDIIDDEDVLPHDLAYSNDEDLINVDDADGMSADIARAHRGDGGGDDHPLPHELAGGCRGKGTWKPNLRGRKAGIMHTRKETQNLGLRKITDELGPQPIQFKWKDNGTMLPLDDHSAHWANILGEIVREFSMHFGSWSSIPSERKAGVLGKIGTQFDLQPRMQSELWPDIRKGIDQHLGNIYMDNKSSLKMDYWVKNPDDETYDVKAIRSRCPANISAEDWDAQIWFWSDPKNMARCAQNA